MQSHVQYNLVGLCSLFPVLPTSHALGSSLTKPLGVSLPLVCTCHSARTIPLVLQSPHTHGTLTHPDPAEVSPCLSAFPHPEEISFCELSEGLSVLTPTSLSACISALGSISLTGPKLLVGRNNLQSTEAVGELLGILKVLREMPWTCPFA